MKKIMVDASKCTGCGQCVLTCAFVKTESFDLKQSNVYLVQWEDICLSVTVACKQCHDAACIEACPVDAIDWNQPLHTIVIDEATCIQCGACVDECTFQVMHNKTDGYPTTCDQCGGDPACVKACYPGSLSYVEVEDNAPEQHREFIGVMIDMKNGRKVDPPPEFVRLADLSPTLKKI